MEFEKLWKRLVLGVKLNQILGCSVLPKSLSHCPKNMLTFSASPWPALRMSKNIATAVYAAKKLFRSSGVPEASAGAEYLAVAAFSQVRTRHEARLFEEKPCPRELSHFVNLCRQRVEKRMPIQYLVGNWDFHDISLNVRRPVLIPRPETEELVEHVLSDADMPRDTNILDIGCGSGAILLSLLNARSNWMGVGMDKSREALSLSAENACKLQLSDRIKFILSDIQSTSLASLGDRQFDAIVSNPPYIPRKDMPTLEPEVSEHEDFGALCGGEDGLDVIRSILKAAPYLVKTNGSIWLEVDPSHPALLDRISFPHLRFDVSYKDLYGKLRFCRFVRE